jgi:Holliday junction resolvase
VTTQGASNRRKGHQAERDLAAYLRNAGWPHAERSVRTGYRTADRTSPDSGDIDGTPGVVWQVKYAARESISRWMDETEVQRLAAKADIGVLVQRRVGHAAVREWWGWVHLVRLGGAAHGVEWSPVRMELGALVHVLHNLGYGEAP